MLSDDLDSIDETLNRPSQKHQTPPSTASSTVSVCKSTLGNTCFLTQARLMNELGELFKKQQHGIVPERAPCEAEPDHYRGEKCSPVNMGRSTADEQQPTLKQVAHVETAVTQAPAADPALATVFPRSARDNDCNPCASRTKESHHAHRDPQRTSYAIRKRHNRVHHHHRHTHVHEHTDMKHHSKMNANIHVEHDQKSV